jgi:MFS family permease
MGQRSFAALSYRDFRCYLSIRFLFTLACQMQITALGFYIYQQTHSKMAIAFVGLCGAIPAIGVALIGGHLADRSEKRRMLLIMYAVVLLSSLVILQCRVLPVLYLMIFFNGVARAFYEPAMHIVYAHSIPREIYPNASNWDSVRWQALSTV